ncbi:tRNA uridine(34) hydroxylase-like [Rhinoraja longicauda]
MEPVSEWIRWRFPAVRSLGPAALEQRLRGQRERLLLLDVRSAAEYEVSHLEGAVRIDPDTSDVETVVKELGLTGGSEEKEVVCYCTAGYHGSEMAERLGKALPPGRGSTRVYSLEGGLVRWANDGKHMVDSGGQTTALVHPYNKVWAQLLEPKYRVPV